MRPVLVSCGDPSGVGPELAAKAWDHLRASEPFCWIGDPSHLPKGTKYQEVDRVGDAFSIASRAMPVLRHDFPAGALPGQPDPANARAVIDVIARGVDLVMRGEGAAICTAPINKKALHDGAGFAFPGHTEYLAHLAGGASVVMMLAAPALKVVPATIHIAIKDVPTAFTREVLREVVRVTSKGLAQDFGIKHPRIAVAGLNPHAGEGGAMGFEEQDWIVNEIKALRNEGYAIAGPLPADTMFHARARAQYDVAICAYHDQALIPIKTLDFDGGVNVTLGLPFIRTSPDHGTAYDIAGQGIATPQSLIAAIKMAAEMARVRG